MTNNIVDDATWSAFVKHAVKELGSVASLATESALGDNYDTGQEGERRVVSKLANDGWTVCQSPGSKSPADVWGCRILNCNGERVLQIWIIQVKSSKSEVPNHPKTDASALANSRREIVTIIKRWARLHGVSLPRNIVVTPSIVRIHLGVDHVVFHQTQWGRITGDETHRASVFTACKRGRDLTLPSRS